MSAVEFKKVIPSVENFNRLRGAAGLSTKDPEKAKIALKNSLFSICAHSDGKLVGIGRVVGDGGVYFSVVDLAVLPEFQGKGIGSGILKRLMKYIDTEAGEGSFVSLFSNRGLAPYYSKYGFQVRPEDSPGMSVLYSK